jgi:hypothetical protein
LVAAPVGGVPGIRQVVWQFAAAELHAIMQFVTVELCASRTLPPACAAEWHNARAKPALKINAEIAPPRMHAFSFRMPLPTSERAEAILTA